MGEQKSGINITMSEQTTDRVATALIDLFSPVTHGAGWLGDKVRLWREASAIKALRRAKQIADEENKVLEPPPPKFLIPYLEAASLEDEADDSLHEKWARLLVNSGASPDSFSYFAKTLLQELSTEDAKILDDVVRYSKMLNYNTHDAYMSGVNKEIADTITRMTKVLEGVNSDTSIDSLTENLGLLLERDSGFICTGYQIFHCPLFRNELGEGVFHLPGMQEYFHSLLILEGRRIIAFSNFTGKHKKGPFVAGLSHISFTSLGFGVAKKLYPSVR